MDGSLSNPDVGVTLPGIAMLIVLSLCFVVEVGLVVTLPGVQTFFRRVLHIGAVGAHPSVKAAH